ncbi:MAG: prephenate dehydrogenase/arogenate dehydrogenase family protein [Candidatus Methylopumilus sp.]|nr:prephenate dehydrogenase/arogenate dehydrogenase family protein [Candidatus Methylopumilus sp.]
MNKILIFGVGLIGGSIALAAKKSAFASDVVGVGRNKDNLYDAIKLKLIDRISDDLKKDIAEAHIIVIASPVAQFPSILKTIQPHLSSHTIITDVGSTKTDVIKSAKEILGLQYSQFIGGHPIAGSEKHGAISAHIDLFKNKNVILTPDEDTSSQAKETIETLWKNAGAVVSNMSYVDHDKIFSTISHLPHLLAFSLVDMITQRANANELLKFAASGFKDFTRIAASSPEMWKDITLANKKFILEDIKHFENEIKLLKEAIEHEDIKKILTLFENASKTRNKWS